MKSLKKLLAVVLCIITVASCFAGCSKAKIAEEITDDTMIIAYTEEKKPFIYTDENGNLTGFEVELMDKIFDNVKNDFSDYQFVQVEEGYRIGEDVAYTDEDGNGYIAYVMIGGIESNKGSFNKEHTFTASIIDNAIITVTPKNSKINTYADMAGATVGVVSQPAKEALDKNKAIENSCKSVKDYKDIESAVADLDAGKLTAIVVDEFTFNIYDKKDNYNILPNQLDTVNYVFAFKKYDWIDEEYNEAIYQLKSLDYDNEDEFTPLVEKYFGYNASDFDYEPVENK